MRIPRPVRITFLLTEKEAAQLRKLATVAGITVADWLREQLRAAVAEK
jgi:hypothetical protein